ncbi:MAG: metalloregulator ArsR/SmtB family transcription factor [Eggerthellaceae bacterium]|nr:metalloregulator ArsR/SmtB family transcription factor [Eggerthellaceae bacterium]
MEEQAKQLAELLRLLANKNRLLILCALEKSPLTVSELNTYIPDISQPALSQHLQLLKTALIIESAKSAQNVQYAIADDRVREIMKTLRTNYCENA